MQLICLVRKLLIMPSKLGAYLKTKEATGTTGRTDQPNPNPDLNLNSNLGAYDCKRPAVPPTVRDRVRLKFGFYNKRKTQFS